MNKILLSVDMDEWYQCRWATGSAYARWPDTQTFFRDYYHHDQPAGEIIPLTERILQLFDENKLSATFFFTGEIASYYPDLVKDIVNNGHEIASHNYLHKDYTKNNALEFYENLKRSKYVLEKLSGQKILGYRAPNSTVSNYMIKDLIQLGFKYDSSITPTRPFMGKFGDNTSAPVNPYQLSKEDFSKPGDSGLWEFPWPVFPILNLPAGSGIMSRIAGYRYTVISLDYALKTGDSVYYFHPYEIGSKPNLGNINFKTRLFLKNLGEPYFRMLCKIIKKYKGQFFSGATLFDLNSGKI
jgi:peptidoglycan/xylan/chitin deacetylase (PgdA/CDA1 family)